MGEAKEIIKGNGPDAKAKREPSDDTKNLVAQTQNVMNEVDKCIKIKDNDTQTEGEPSRADNLRKATLLRACYTLLKGAKTLMEEY